MKGVYHPNHIKIENLNISFLAKSMSQGVFRSDAVQSVVVTDPVKNQKIENFYSPQARLRPTNAIVEEAVDPASIGITLPPPA
ncbi:MAG: hypothetical protein K0R12_654 [Gammaproteobacteria bacterium]|jgi:hypothetical protein|nr:hypothetical protein [Gammaproteobacteria bacterium]